MGIIEQGIELYRETGMAKLFVERSEAFGKAHTLDRQKISTAINILANDAEMQQVFQEHIAALRKRGEEIIQDVKSLSMLNLQSFGILDSDGMQLLVPVEYATLRGCDGLVKELFENAEGAMSLMGKPRVEEKDGFVYIVAADKKNMHREAVNRLRYVPKNFIDANTSHIVSIAYGPIYTLEGQMVVSRRPNTETRHRRQGVYDDVKSALSATEGISVEDIATLTECTKSSVYGALDRMIKAGEARMDKGQRMPGKRYSEPSKYFLVSKPNPDDVPAGNTDAAPLPRVNGRPLDAQIAKILVHYDGMQKGTGATERELASRYGNGFADALNGGYLKKNGDTFVLTEKGAMTRGLLPAAK